MLVCASVLCVCVFSVNKQFKIIATYAPPRRMLLQLSVVFQ